MKMKTIKKYIQHLFGRNIICVDYCAVQFLMRGREPMWCTSSKVYGWLADIYHLGDGLAIATGYVPFGDIRLSYDFVQKYESAAFEALSRSDKAEHERIFQAFVQAIRNGEGRK